MLAQDLGALYIVDACQVAGERPINVCDLSCHGLAASGRKWLRGPAGPRYSYARAGKQIIIQCKRFVETEFDGLLCELRKEADKVCKLKPGRSTLMTAAPLSDANMTRILAVKPLGLLAVDRDAVTAKQNVQTSIAEPPALLRQLT